MIDGWISHRYIKTPDTTEFNRKKLQVFISSTYSDLVDDRQAAVEAILTAGHIPAGMELFTSGDESQLEVIKQWIVESDVFLLILAGRYGSIEPKSEKSYIQLDYEHAISVDKPMFACVIEENALENRLREHGSSAMEKDHPQMLKEFRATVSTKLVKFWEDSKDIKIAIGETLSQIERRDDLSGWVPAANMEEASELLQQLNTLRIEKDVVAAQYEEMKARFENLGGDELVDTAGFAQGKDEVVIKMTAQQKDNAPQDVQLPVCWDDVFLALGPRLLAGLTYDDAAQVMGEALAQRSIDEAKSAFVVMSDESMDVIRMQLLALRLIRVETRTVHQDKHEFVGGKFMTRSKAETKTVWILTPRGERDFFNAVALRRDA